jgi:hypothetical protein
MLKLDKFPLELQTSLPFMMADVIAKASCGKCYYFKKEIKSYVVKMSVDKRGGVIEIYVRINDKLLCEPFIVFLPLTFAESKADEWCEHINKMSEFIVQDFFLNAKEIKFLQGQKELLLIEMQQIDEEIKKLKEG